jgi:hypothetical protein
MIINRDGPSQLPLATQFEKKCWLRLWRTVTLVNFPSQHAVHLHVKTRENSGCPLVSEENKNHSATTARRDTKKKENARKLKR